MILEYKSPSVPGDIRPILDEYVVWYGGLIKSYLEEKPVKLQPPSVFVEWVNKTTLPVATADKARNIHDGMIEAAKKFALKNSPRGNAPLAEYTELSKYYEEFIQMIHRLEIEAAAENAGVDEATGLRSLKLMAVDINREMERRARRGSTFSLVLIKINEFDDSWRGRQAHIQPMVRGISDHIGKCLRSFDDAYYLGEEFFLLSLKHTDMLGAQAAMNRLNVMLQEEVVLSPDDSRKEMSVSAVLCEPAQGDTLPDLMTNMKKDLSLAREKGEVFQYSDVSPLQRYMNSIETEV